MTLFSATIFASTVLMFEGFSIQSEAASIQRLYSEMAYVSNGVCESMEDQPGCESVDFYDPLQRCFWDPDEGKCYLSQDEDECEFLPHTEDSCNESSGCAWVMRENYSRPGEGHCVSYKNISEGSCAYNVADFLHTVSSKDKCNDIKGCSWHKGDGRKKTCQVAPSQLVCEDFETKNTCKKNGCGWGGKGKGCTGRWERRFLDFLVGKDVVEAKTAIQEEYGEAYIVHVEAVKTYVPERITLVVDKEGVIVETPLFG